jgi:hypothetical protein
MKYSIKSKFDCKSKASIHIKESEIIFGITPKTADSVANPAELFLGSFAACALKMWNVFDYDEF